jgi:hypothetical protein
MKEKTVSLLNFDLQLVEKTNYAVLSVGIGSDATNGRPPRLEQQLRMPLTIGQVRQLQQALTQALATHDGAALRGPAH